MNSPTQPPVDAAEIDEQAAAESIESEVRADIPAFKFPFKPGELAAGKSASQPWYKNGSKNGHTKSPGMPPPGTRRTMGKR